MNTVESFEKDVCSTCNGNDFYVDFDVEWIYNMHIANFIKILKQLKEKEYS